MLTHDAIEGWCAACKVSGITETALTHKNFPSIETIMKNSVIDVEASVIVVSVNEEEHRVLEWLKVNKFRKGPVVKSWRYGGRKTWLFFKNIPKRIYDRYKDTDW